MVIMQTDVINYALILQQVKTIIFNLADEYILHIIIPGINNLAGMPDNIYTWIWLHVFKITLWRIVR